jgi:hypothetical protein
MKTKILTKDFLNFNKTPKGGYTKAQLRLIGVAWPPEKGWQARIIGTVVAAKLADDFAAARYGEKSNPLAAARDLIVQCMEALEIELEAWDLDPPLDHVQKACDACKDWLAHS